MLMTFVLSINNVLILTRLRFFFFLMALCMSEEDLDI